MRGAAARAAMGWSRGWRGRRGSERWRQYWAGEEGRPGEPWGEGRSGGWDGVGVGRGVGERGTRQRNKTRRVTTDESRGRVILWLQCVAAWQPQNIDSARCRVGMGILKPEHEPNLNRLNCRSIRVFGFEFSFYICYILGYGFEFGFYPLKPEWTK